MDPACARLVDELYAPEGWLARRWVGSARAGDLAVAVPSSLGHPEARGAGRSRSRSRRCRRGPAGGARDEAARALGRRTPPRLQLVGYPAPNPCARYERHGADADSLERPEARRRAAHVLR